MSYVTILHRPPPPPQDIADEAAAKGREGARNAKGAAQDAGEAIKARALLVYLCLPLCMRRRRWGCLACGAGAGAALQFLLVCLLV